MTGTAMDEPLLNYPRLVERAMRRVAGDALALVAEHGLPGGHHFYITFRTRDPGVDIPDFLRAEYPEEMTIVLQHQFWGLEVDAVGFAVTLSFRGEGARLRVPFEALVAFADPEAKFGLQFETPGAAAEGEAAGTAQDSTTDDGSADVVTLDAFRKKT